MKIKDLIDRTITEITVDDHEVVINLSGGTLLRCQCEEVISKLVTQIGNPKQVTQIVWEDV